MIGVPECDQENESKLENTVQENFPNLARQATIQVEEIQRTPQRYSSRRAHNRQIHQGLNEGKNAKDSQRQRTGYPQREAHQTHSGFLSRNSTSQREWGPIFNILREKNFQPRISYPFKLSFISKGEIKSFTNKQLLRDLVTTRPALQEILKEALIMERNQYQPL